MLAFQPAPARLPAGQRIYAVGDVHGCVDRLREMHRAIAADLDERPIGAALLLHIGDYIDRGPDAAGVLDLLVRGPAVPAVRVVNLMGNHEDMLLAALDGASAEAAEHWLFNGAAASLASWGVRAEAGPAEWRRRIPRAHLEFVRTLALQHRAGGYLFVHGGVQPGIPLERQSPHDLLWIREPFLSHSGEFGAVVVHGHTPVRRPVVRPNRIGIDTGAVYGGALTCAVFEGERLGFMFH